MDLQTTVEIRALGNAEPPFATPALLPNTIHVWHRSLAFGARDVRYMRMLYDLLSRDERSKAGSFRFEKHAAAFIQSRGTLRILLASYLGRFPGELALAYSTHGKPSLSSSPQLQDLRFNISHTEGWSAFAFSQSIELGIDIEKVQSDANTRYLAEQIFSNHEWHQLCSLPEGTFNDAFYRCWTRKESYIKARGEGLSIPLQQFDVSVAPGEASALLAVRPNTLDASQWTVGDLSVQSGYAGALTYRRSDSSGLWQRN